MSDEVIITVRGESERRVAPEQARAHITVAADGPERGAVVERIAALAEPVRAGLGVRREAGAVSEWNSQRVSVWAQRPWNDAGEQLPPVHYASVEFTATFTDTIALSDWINTLAEQDGVQIGHVAWQLTPEVRARTEREVATSAVAVAVERATAYAAAIGRGTVIPLEIADVGLLGSGEPTHPAMLRAAKAEMAFDGGAPAVDFHPDDIVITATVEARFRAV